MHQLEPMSDEVNALLREADPFDPPAGAEERVLSRLREALPPVLPAQPAPAAPRPPLSLGGPLALATLVLGVGLGWVLHEQFGTARVEVRTVEVQVPVPAPVVAAPAPEPAPVAAVKEPVRKPARPTPSAPAVAKEQPSSDLDLARERELIEQARNALVRGEVKAANDALGQHASRFPRGRLAEERDSLWVQSLIRAGDFPAARARAQQFQTSYPNSLLLPAVEAALRTIPPR